VIVKSNSSNNETFFHIQERINITDKGTFVIISKQEFYKIISLTFVVGMAIMFFLFHIF